MVKTPNKSTHSHSFYHTKHSQPLKYPVKTFDMMTCMTAH